MAETPVALDAWAKGQRPSGFYFNATGVARAGRAALFLGAPGAGKSTTALALMALGAELISDDGIWLSTVNGQLMLERPDPAPDLIEARGVGLLPAGPICSAAQLALVVDLDSRETDRLPLHRKAAAMGRTCPLILGREHPNLAPVIWHILRHGYAEM